MLLERKVKQRAKHARGEKKERLKKRIQQAQRKEKESQAIKDPIQALENVIDEERRKKRSIYRKLKRETTRLKESERTLKIRVKSLTSKIRGKCTPLHHSSSSSSASDFETTFCLSPASSPFSPKPKQTTPLSKHIYSLLSPGTKRKTRRALSLNKPSGLAKNIRAELGINIHKHATLKLTSREKSS